MIAQWLSVLSIYDFDIENRRGSAHTNADGMSRKPHRKCKNQNGSDCIPLQQSITHRVPEAVPVHQDTLSYSKGTVMPVVALTYSDLNHGHYNTTDSSNEEREFKLQQNLWVQTGSNEQIKKWQALD